jgi:signal transduction histidine kinase
VPPPVSDPATGARLARILSAADRRVSGRRLLAAGLLAASLAGLAGGALEWWWFGPDADAAAGRGEAHVRDAFDRMTGLLSRVGGSIAEDPAAGAALDAGPDDARVLFDLVQRRVAESGGNADDLSVTVFDAAGDARAWIGRPSDTYGPRLSGPPSFFVTPSALGLRLVHVLPVTGASGGRVGAVAAEHVLSPARAAAAITNADYVLTTPLGPASLRTRLEGAGDEPRPGAFLLRTPAGEPLVEASLSADDLRAARIAWRRRVAAVALGFCAVAMLLLVGPLLDRRAAAPTTRAFMLATFGAAASVVAAALLLWTALDVGAAARPPHHALLLLASCAAAGLVALAASPVVRLRLALRGRPEAYRARPAAFAAAHLSAGVVVAAFLVAYERVLLRALDPSVVDLRHFSIYPTDGERLAVLCGILACHAAALWGGTLVLSAALAWWRVPPTAARARAAAFALWLAPSAALSLLAQARGWPIPAMGLFLSALVPALAALVSRRVVAWHRHTTVAARILVSFLAFLLPSLLLYPSVEFFVNRELRRVVATQYAVEAQNHPEELQDRLGEALREIDTIPHLDELVAGEAAPPGGPASADSAFFVWRKTVLARMRLTSAVELYRADGSLVSPFALNFPEYAGAAQAPQLPSTCRWDVFGEAAPFGSDERGMLHAQRGVCDRDGRIVGTIVVHVVPDYRSLPFITSQSPYYELFRLQEGAGRRAGALAVDVQAVIYGWSLAPIYTSGSAVWPIDDRLFARIYESRDPFWTIIEHDGSRYRVHFSNDRSGIYAVGYRAPTLFDDLVHVAELTTLSGSVFVVVLLATAVFTRVARRRPRVGRELLREIRASFYRKLFLAFVLASIIPVLTLALVIRAYFANLLNADIAAEAARTAAVAQRVIEESDRLVRGTVEGFAAVSDDVMVWLSQILNQDVNIFEGPRLLATSERDLFASGLLPTRTPVDVYRAIALQRLPQYVGQDRIGEFEYMVAAAPVRAGGEHMILSVPLADQQREIEREIDELDRGVHLAALFFVLLGAGIGLSMAERIADPVRRLTIATRRIARGDFDAQIAVRSADELRRLVDAFNSMAAELKAQRVQLERTHRLEAWAEMARQVAHEIKNPLTPIQLSAEHLQRVHADRGEPLGPVLDTCITSILGQVRLLRQISAEFSSFASAPTARPAAVEVPELVGEVIDPYRTGLAGRIEIVNLVAPPLPRVFVDRTLVARALSNIVENALHAMPGTGRLTLDARAGDGFVAIEVRDTGVGMDDEALARAFEPYFSTKATGTGLGLAIARRNVEINGGGIDVKSQKGEGTLVRLRLPIHR